MKDKDRNSFRERDDRCTFYGAINRNSEEEKISAHKTRPLPCAKGIIIVSYK